ncbi:MAG: hypothetical protein GY855_09100 [candidate division Zixibacteria bacterium]|nr:hypothetical protein [candidate division Zixibacteria bacterium]
MKKLMLMIRSALPVMFLFFFCFAGFADADLVKKKKKDSKNKTSVVQKSQDSKKSDPKKKMPSASKVKPKKNGKYDVFIDNNKDGINDKIKKPQSKPQIRKIRKTKPAAPKTTPKQKSKPVKDKDKKSK